MIHLTVQRFQEGDPFYTETVIFNRSEDAGFKGTFYSVFGQLLDQDGKFICYTLERKDTLISEGTRNFVVNMSPRLHYECPIFEDEPGTGTYNRGFRIHVANYAYQLEGCTATGVSIDTRIPAVLNSKAAFDKVMGLIGKEGGTITHEKRISM